MVIEYSLHNVHENLDDEPREILEQFRLTLPLPPFPHPHSPTPVPYLNHTNFKRCFDTCYN